MAKQVFLTDLDVALAHLDPVGIGPVTFDPTYADGWQDRGRPASTGGFEAEGVLCHHTASPSTTTDETDLRVIIAGNGSAPGPISQLYLGRSGTLYIVAAGRANHGGGGVIPGETTKSDMNARSIGIEVGNNGVGEPWSDLVSDRYAATVAALIDYYGWGLDKVWLHATTGPPAGNFKIDPAGPWQRQPNLPGGSAGTWNLDIWRQFVDEHAGHTPPQPPPSTPGADRRKGMSDFVVIYGVTGVADGTVLELIAGKKRYVSGDEWYQVLKGVVADRDGRVPNHDPWQPVATFTNGWYAISLPDYNTATAAAMADVPKQAPS